jgi:hypothetical protein
MSPFYAIFFAIKRIESCLTLTCYLMLGIAIAGCQNSKQSLYEEIDHETPAHWPSDMADAASKIHSRLELLASQPDDSVARSELVDLVSWCAEVAADTDVSEQQWMPIYEYCEAIRKRVQAGVAIDSLFSELQQLCTTLEAAHQGLPSKPTF